MHYTIYRGWFGEHPPLHPMHYANLKNDRDINPKGEVFLITSSSSMSKENFDIQSKMCEALGVKMLDLSDDKILETLFNEYDDYGNACIPNIEDLKNDMKKCIQKNYSHYAQAFDIMKLVVITKPRSIAIDIDSRIVRPLDQISKIVRDKALEKYDPNDTDNIYYEESVADMQALYDDIVQDTLPVLVSASDSSIKYIMNIGIKKTRLDFSISPDYLVINGLLHIGQIVVCSIKNLGIILGRMGLANTNKILHQDQMYCHYLCDKDNGLFYESMSIYSKDIMEQYHDNEMEYNEDMAQKYKQDKDYVESLLKTCTTSQNSEPTNLIPTASCSIEGGSRQSYNTDKAYESNKPHEKVKWHDGSELFEKW